VNENKTISTMTKKTQTRSFEEELQRIEQIIQAINSDKMPLDEALNLHAEAKNLIRNCEVYLNQAAVTFEEIEGS
jgi:exodeoxyribonuclease VII small subunit